MKTGVESPPEPDLHDQEPARAKMRADVLAGLAGSPKALPSQYLYDERGARLFERICEQPEYYLTQTELAILASCMEEIAERVGEGAVLIEPGSGEGTKSARVLAGLHAPAGFVPIDISRAQLLALASTTQTRFPDVEVAPVCADFTEDPELPPIASSTPRRVAFFPGSTIGNFAPDNAVEVLRHLHFLCGARGRVLIGVDLKKEARLLEPAYDDAAGFSRAFALNYLTRLNRELGADFDLEGFDYEAPYDAEHGRIEMALVSRRDQVAHVAGEPISLARDERISTEHSYKYDVDEFVDLARAAGLERDRVWTDPARLFAVLLLTAA